jgi:hypothetical protein
LHRRTGRQEVVVPRSVLLFIASIGLASAVAAESAAPGVIPGERVQVLTRRGDWRQGTFDSLTQRGFQLRERADSPPTWIECESVAGVYRQAPGASTTNVLTGTAVGFLAGVVVGLVVASNQDCDGCEVNPGPVAAFTMSVGIGTVAGTAVGFIPRRHWERTSVCADGRP